MTEYLTTKELAELLRIKERKVYDLAAAGDVPCSRVMGKLLFPRAAVMAWVSAHSSGLERAARVQLPGVFLGSHDPLLDWALRESRCGLATYFDGSMDGLERFLSREGVATGMHLYDGGAGAWNTPVVGERCASLPVVLVEWATRSRGLIVAKGAEKSFSSLAALKGTTFAPRQPEAGAQVLFLQLLAEAGLKTDDLSFIAPERTEIDAALAVLDGRAQATLGLKSVAAQHRLGFVPVIDERFDILVDRRAWFEPPLQMFLAFCRSQAFMQRALDMPGYDISNLGAVRFNGP